VLVSKKGTRDARDRTPTQGGKGYPASKRQVSKTEIRQEKVMTIVESGGKADEKWYPEDRRYVTGKSKA